jgi:chemotaxis methyl-accepting protein methylase
MNDDSNVSLASKQAAIDLAPESLGRGELAGIVRHVAEQSGHDLSQYRRGPIFRRLKRRARESRLGSITDYGWQLRRTPAELDSLLPWLLGRASRFFRAPAQLAALRSMVLEPLLAHRRAEGPLKVWIIGCSTGEEAYSIAMLLLEVSARAPANELQIIATDVDPRSIEVARRGAYGPRIARSVSTERLERFFLREGPGYRVDEHVRKRILFSTHDPLIDPPFADLDLIVCRNLLDSLKPAPRSEVLARLRAGLKPGGSLLLGPSESRPVPLPSFSVLEARQRLFVRTAYDLDTVGESEVDGADQPLGSPSARLEAANESLRIKVEGLAAADADLKTLLGSTQVAILLDPDLRIRSFTGASRDLFHIVAADRGRRIAELPRRFAYEDLAGAILRGRDVPGGVEEEVLGDDGRWYAMRALAHLNDEGAIAGSVLTFVEITARKAAEELLGGSRELVANVSHELRTPLHAIIGYVDLLSEESTGSGIHMLAGIRRSANGVLELSSALLDMSRLDHTRTSAHLGVVSVSALIAEVIEEIRVGQGKAGPRIHGPLAAHVPDLFTDALRLKIALGNVIGNAVKYGRGDVHVDVGPSGGGLEFSISDRGPGIPLAQQRRVFEQFHQSATAVWTGAVGAGVGLGLYVTRRLIESLGGSIDLESRPGTGSTFRLWLPSRIEAPRELQPRERFGVNAAVRHERLSATQDAFAAGAGSPDRAPSRPQATFATAVR